MKEGLIQMWNIIQIGLGAIVIIFVVRFLVGFFFKTGAILETLNDIKKLLEKKDL